MTTILVLPHQLFKPATYLALAQKHAADTFLIFEDPVFYGDRNGQAGVDQLKLNKLRIAYQKMLVWQFKRDLTSAAEPFGLSIKYEAVEELAGKSEAARYQPLKTPKKLISFEVCDLLFTERLKNAGVGLYQEDSPMWLASRGDIDEFLKETNFHSKPKVLLRMAPWYNFMKSKLKILQKTPSLDTLNRESYPADAPSPPSPYVTVSKSDLPAKAAEWLETSQYKSNPGPENKKIVHELARLPANHTEASDWLKKFIAERFRLFGPFEDAIVPGQPWMYHSGLSIFMNFGLVTPKEVVNAIREYYEALPASSKKTELPSYEGFIRQMLGWRELCRVYYLNVPLAVCRKNVFNLKGKLGTEWYDWTTKSKNVLPPVVYDAVKDGWELGYLHHIRRLMVVSNYMNISGISPDEAYKWLYEFALDGWDWAMRLNVYGMGSWSDGGVSLRKPYVSSSGYIEKMTPKQGKKQKEAGLESGKWQDDWNKRFRSFIDDHADVIKHTELARFLKK